MNSIEKVNTLPLQIFPFPKNPVLQLHKKDPSVLLQFALTSQADGFLHSSISESIRILKVTQVQL